MNKGMVSVPLESMLYLTNQVLSPVSVPFLQNKISSAVLYFLISSANANVSDSFPVSVMEADVDAGVLISDRHSAFYR